MTESTGENGFGKSLVDSVYCCGEINDLLMINWSKDRLDRWSGKSSSARTQDDNSASQMRDGTVRRRSDAAKR